MSKNQVSPKVKATPELLKEHVDKLGWHNPTGNEPLAREATLRNCQLYLDFPFRGGVSMKFMEEQALYFFYAYKQALDDITLELGKIIDRWPGIKSKETK